MSKNAYPYPLDEFDEVDINSRPKEVHAARRGAWGRVWPFLLVIILVPAIAFLAVHFLADKLPGGPASPSPSAPPATVVPESPPVSGVPEDPVQSQEPVPETPPPPDKAVKVTVYNDGRPTGAAGTASDALTSAGYTNATKSYDTTPASPTQSIVYYSTAEQAATASDVAATLEITMTELNAQAAGGNIVVILK
ncbi:MAG: LytR C-terminal domain-containing protein [Bifidobacteriaceae bacterium]|nr:LytR C-terminal domain-containing protein [Bifidobacteriaceae bacterium]